MDDKLLIPEKIKVGYQKRSDTYTEKLAYVIYYDSKGVLRKETSWQGWRDNSIDFDDYENIPTEGFVLNKGVGGTRHSYGWNTRNEYIRVYDPRGFEFEISVANLLFILQECTSTKGKGLEGEFVFSWSGKELVLLPVSSQEYKVSTEFTDLQALKVGARDLQPGYSYLTKDMKSLTYLGRFMFYSTEYENRESYDYITRGKKGHIFYDPEFTHWSGDDIGGFSHFKSMTKLAKVNSTEEVSDYAEIMDKFNKSKHCAPTVDIVATPKKIDFLKDCKEKSNYNTTKEVTTFLDNGDGSYTDVSIEQELDYRDDNKVKGYSIELGYTFRIEKGGLRVKSDRNDNSYRVEVFKHNKLRHLTKIQVNKDNNSRYGYNNEYYYTLEQVNSVDYTHIEIKMGNGELAEASRFTTTYY